uniref:Transient receptor potential cation channel, subfamily V, member 6 n=1 Tax=Mastacembelus armatus TaxID=205130 RepID=A0A3Q3KLW8_9TELE
MSPYLARSFAVQLSHWWSQLNKKRWDEILDETFLLHNKLINDIPLFYAAKTNNLRISSLLCALGETALHIAAMNDNLEAALALMDGAPELINEPMTSELFQGITPLHIAVENQNISLVHHLISRGGDVETPRATGLYFRKRRGGLIYYGEHVLSFAVCTGNKDIISMIIDAGASTRVQDYRGNTVLHVLVLQPNKVAACQTIDLIMAHNAELHEEVPLDMVRNIRGLTPFKLAAKEGNTVVFQHLINKRRICQWSLGSLSSNLYDLTEIDSRADNMSVLELIVSSHNKEVRRLLEVTPVKQLVSLKWNLYGKHYFRLLILLYLLHIGIFTVCCLFRPLKDIPQNYTQSPMDKTIMIEKSLRESYVTHEDNLRLAGEIISLLGAFIILFIEIPDIVKVGAKRFFGHTAMGGPFHVILISYASLVVLLFVFRLCNVPGEIDVMALCLVFCWCNATFFSRGFEMLSSHSIMIQKIILEDLGKFMWQMLIIIIAFSTGIWIVYMTQDPTSIPPYASFALTLFYETELISGFVNLPFDPTIYTPPIVCVMHVVFASVVCILLVNLLIAMLTDTEWKVAKQKDLLWKFQMVAIILMVERRLPRCLWPRFGVCGLKYGLKERWYLRLEERNHRIMQEGKRYKEDVKKRDGLDKTAQKETVSRIPDLKPKNSFGKTAKGWSLSHHSTLDMEMELKGLEEDIKYV